VASGQSVEATGDKPVFATLEQNLILKRLGVLHPPDQAALRQAIAAVLG
jgi:hypothetical protein